jgi:hypothetical protein
VLSRKRKKEDDEEKEEEDDDDEEDEGEWQRVEAEEVSRKRAYLQAQGVIQ